MEFCPTLPDHDYVVKSPESHESQLHAAQKRIKELEEEVIQLKAEQFGLARFGYDNKMIQFYTGFKSADLLHEFIRFVKPTASLMKTWSQVQNGSKLVSNSTSPAILHRQASLSIEDQIFLFLVRVKLGRLTVDLAVAFKVSPSTVSRTVITWANFLYFTLGRLPIWPTRAQIQRHLPPCFKLMFPNVRVILDCTEIFVEVPSSLVLQSEVFSSYKNHTTWKGMFGITPAGAVSCVSALYCGSISDKEISRCSGIIELLDSKDDIMADKGFIIRELLEAKDCNLIIPPFLNCEEQFAEEETEQTKQIAMLRIHVERAIRRVKEYHIFDSPISMSLSGSINQIWTVCCLLTNFRGYLY